MGLAEKLTCSHLGRAMGGEAVAEPVSVHMCTNAAVQHVGS